MITKKEYDAALNEGWVAFGKLPVSVQRVIHEAKRVDYLTDNGMWVEKTARDFYHVGQAYRISPDTEHREEGEVPACDIKGFKLWYPSGSGSGRIQFDVHGAKVYITREDLANLFGMQQNQQLIRDWFELNRPKE